jgi:hypothetical protein
MSLLLFSFVRCVTAMTFLNVALRFAQADRGNAVMYIQFGTACMTP